MEAYVLNSRSRAWQLAPRAREATKRKWWRLGESAGVGEEKLSLWTNEVATDRLHGGVRDGKKGGGELPMETQ